MLALGIGAALVGGGLAVGNSKWFSSEFHDSFLSNRNKKARLAKAKRNREWAEKIIAGGYILHFRHAQREKWYDSAAFDAWELANGINAAESSFSKATCLTPRGVEEAKLIGNVFRYAGVKVSEVYSSPSCRAWQTAEYAFGTYKKTNTLLNRTAIIPEQRPEFAKALRNLIMNLKIEPGSNVVMTGHGATLEADGKAVIDEDNTGKRRNRKETGFFVLERKDGRIIAHYKFTSIKEFANAVIKLSVE
jgi:phosphohistidine phosphatase SixA